MKENPSWHEQRDRLRDLQGGLCGFCGIPLLDNDPLDHDHETGLTSGLLCPGCNQMVDYSSHPKAVAYRDQPPAAGFDWFYEDSWGRRPEEVHRGPTYAATPELAQVLVERLTAGGWNFDELFAT